MRRWAVLAGLFCLVIATAIWALTVGSSPLPASRVVAVLLQGDGSRESIVVVSLRLPRVLAGLLVGASLATAGAIMQAITHNPLASPGLLGINAGAAFAVVIAVILVDPAPSTFALYAFVGAAVAAVVVYAIGSAGRGGATPLKLTLSGAVFGTFVTSLTTAILIFDQSTLDNIRLWSTGSLSGRSLPAVATAAPYIGAGLLMAGLFCRQIMTLSLGTDTARSLGQNTLRWRLVAALIVILLAGAAVSLAGPVGFVGLVVPHIARLVVGIDYRWILPFSALGGALLVVLADAALRHAIPGLDLPVGVTMAIVGAPFFIYLARYRLGGAG